MRKGSAPFTIEDQSYGSQQRYILHHRDPIANGGSVYDMNNLVVVTPLMHQSILDSKFHFGRDSR